MLGSLVDVVHINFDDCVGTTAHSIKLKRFKGSPLAVQYSIAIECGIGFIGNIEIHILPLARGIQAAEILHFLNRSSCASISADRPAAPGFPDPVSKIHDPLFDLDIDGESLRQIKKRIAPCRGIIACVPDVPCSCCRPFPVHTIGFGARGPHCRIQNRVRLRC